MWQTVSKLSLNYKLKICCVRIVWKCNLRFMCWMASINALHPFSSVLRCILRMFSPSDHFRKLKDRCISMPEEAKIMWYPIAPDSQGNVSAERCKATSTIRLSSSSSPIERITKYRKRNHTNSSKRDLTTFSTFSSPRGRILFKEGAP